MTAPIASGWSEIAGWALHPLESAALSRRTPNPAVRMAMTEPLRSTTNPTFTTSPMGDRVGQKRPFASGSPLRGNRRLSQFVEQSLGFFEVGGVEAFGEPGEDRGEQCHRLLRPALLLAQAGEAHR